MIGGFRNPGAYWHGRMWALAWPIMLSNVSHSLLGAVDTGVMGRLPDPAYIGAVAVGSVILSYFLWIFGFLRMSTTGLTAQAVFGVTPAAGAGGLSAIASASAGVYGQFAAEQEPNADGVIDLLDGLRHRPGSYAATASVELQVVTLSIGTTIAGQGAAEPGSIAGTAADVDGAKAAGRIGGPSLPLEDILTEDDGGLTAGPQGLL